jgi:8-oxo-dGTP pyrophosphatase MutT (NUDIX family)
MTPPHATPSGAGAAGRRPLRRVDETSAGGLVLDRLGSSARGALIGRLDRRGRLLWSLPKGHVEPGETEAQTAVREVAEETGISGRVIGQAGDHRLLVRGRGPTGAQDRPPLPAARHRPRPRLELSDADVEVSEVALVPLERAPRAPGLRRRAAAARPRPRPCWPTPPDATLTGPADRPSRDARPCRLHTSPTCPVGACRPCCTPAPPVDGGPRPRRRAWPSGALTTVRRPRRRPVRRRAPYPGSRAAAQPAAVRRHLRRRRLRRRPRRSRRSSST